MSSDIEDRSSRFPSGLDTDSILLAILSLLVDEREQRALSRPSQTKTEVVLADAGLPHGVIARMLNKQPDAVRMAITRARAKTADSKVRSGGSRKKVTDAGVD